MKRKLFPFFLLMFWLLSVSLGTDTRSYLAATGEGAAGG